MQEPSSLREQSGFSLAQAFPVGIVISQEEAPPRRVQVRIPVLHTDVEDEDLPYFRVGLPLTISGQDGRSAQYTTIAAGTEVQCILYDPRGYSGAVLCQFANTKNDIGKPEDLYGWRDDAGNSLNVTKEGDTAFTGAGGANLTLTKDNVLTITAKDLVLNIGDITITAENFAETITTITSTSQTWTVNSDNPEINDSEGGGGGEGQAPDITAPELPDRPDVANKKDM